MIKATNISFSYGEKPVFDMANFLVAKNHKVGLVGPNGAGKSTLFKLILGREDLSGGSLSSQGSIGYVPQEVKRDIDLEEADSILDYLDPERKKETHELRKLLSGLELDDMDLDIKPESLSGGQKTKLALARALIKEPDILLLDEPTNFMDIQGRNFVMNFLSNYPKILIVISHDLDLLDHAINKVLAVNNITRKIDEYSGNYTKYQKLKKEKEDLLKREIIVKEKHIKQMEKGLIRMARFTSDKGVRRRVQQKRRIEKEKANLPEMPREVAKMKLNLPEPLRVGELPIRLFDIAKSFGNKKVVENLSFSVKRGEKFLLIGPNGSGKSTVIKIMLGLVTPEHGFVEKADNLKVGYYSQEFENLDLEEKVIDLVRRVGKVDEQRARGFLARFMFDAVKVNQRIETLSGGEKTRLSIALLMLEDNNLLILDEPTTYLDPMSQRIILEAVKEYKGTIILVSHVEEFVKEITPSRGLFMPEGKVKLWENELLNSVNEI